MSNPKRGAVLRAATDLFSRHGVRRTSMDLIAREAGVAKPTLYAYFEDKDDLYAAVCSSVGEQIVNAARAAARSEGSLVERVASVLSAKFTRVFELVDTSPYAHELLGANNIVARRNIDAADAAFREVLSRLLDAEAKAGALDLSALGLSLGALAEQLMQVGHGAGYGATSVGEQRANLAALCASVLRAGLSPATSKRRPRGKTRSATVRS